MSKLFSLDGRVALVTGGSRGIGRMIAAGFLQQGAKVYISARHGEVCDATAAELSAEFGAGRCVSLPADVSDAQGVQALVAAFAQHEASLDILVNNAGAAFMSPPKYTWRMPWKVLAGISPASWMPWENSVFRARMQGVDLVLSSQVPLSAAATMAFL